MIRIYAQDEAGSLIKILTQWDRGITIYLSHALITEALQVHFESSNTTTALVKEGALEEDGRLSATIPDSLLKAAAPINGYVFIDDDDYGQSILTFTITVRARKQPEDVVYEDDDDWISISEILERLDSLEGTDAETIAAAVAEYMAENPIDLSAYSTTEEVAEAISTALAEYLKTADLDLSAYSTTAEMTEAIASAINGIDLSAYALAADIPDLSGYSTTKEVTEAINAAVSEIDLSGYALKTDIPDTSVYLETETAESTYAKKTDIPGTLPNPYALTINGTSYDGSAAVDITIAEESTDLSDVESRLTTLEEWVSSVSDSEEEYY